MNIKFFNVALGVALTATAINASAQKAYTSGAMTLSTEMRGQPAVMKAYFTPDSAAFSFTAGPATIKLLSDAKSTLMDIFVDVPVANMKKVAILTPAEIEQALDDMPKFTYVPGTETKTISGFNCKKVVATNTKTNKTYDVWITNDITLPSNAVAKYYAAIGGVPIQYTSFNSGQESSVTVTSITDEKAPAGTFAVSPDFEKISYDDLKQLGGGR